LTLVQQMTALSEEELTINALLITF